MLRRIPIALIAAFAAVLLLAGVASAQAFKTGNNTTVAGSETVDSAAYIFGNTVDVAGTVNGDLYCAGQTVNISGIVNGDIFCAGQTVTFSGTATGSVRLAGQTVDISGKANSVTVTAQNANLSDNATIAQDINGAASTLTIAKLANVGRDVTYAASNITINGTVGRNLKVDAEQLTLGSGANIGGNVAYTSVNQVTKAPDTIVAGTVTQTVPQKDVEQAGNIGFGVSIAFVLYFFAAVMVLLIALVLLFPSLYKESAARVGTSPWMTLLIGFIAVVMVPVLLLCIALTIVGLPLAILLGFMWLVVIMLSGSFSSYYLGSLLLKKQKNPILVMVAGGALLIVLYVIPVLGFFVAMVSTVLGVGIILRELMRRTPKPKY